MKKLIITLCSAVMAVLTGCKTMPTPAELETASYAIGVSTALVCNMTKISDKDRQIIIDVMNEVKYCCPAPGQSIVDAWTDVAKKAVDDLVKKGLITELEGQLILKTFNLVASAGDYMIRIRWPKIGQRADLVLAATNGFCDGFLTAFKPANTNGFAAAVATRNYDQDAYNYLMSIKNK